MSNRRAGKVPVHSITSAAAPLGDDIARRSRRYLAQMTLRTLCFLGAVFTWGHVPTPVSVSLLIGAVVLPYVAVVLANAGRERPEQADPYTEALLQLGTSPAPSATDARSPLDERYGRSPFEQSVRGDHAPHGTGHPFDQARSDDDRARQDRFDDAFYDRSPFDDGPGHRSATDRTGQDGAARNGSDRG